MYILAVDDERLALDNLEIELKKVFPKKEIHCEMKPSEAYEWAQKLKERGEELRYAFLDIEMGSFNGIELARALKSIYPNLIISFCTAYSQYALEAFEIYAKGYLLKPISADHIKNMLDEMVTDWKSSLAEEHQVKIQTFGNFEVFVDDKVLKFEREKSKELFAYLIDRHGATVTTKEIAMVLYEDIEYDQKTKNVVTKIVSSLRKTLKEAGVDDVLIKTWNHIAIDTARVKCDAYDFEEGNVTAINAFHGEYMKDYSWAEFTTGDYTFIKEAQKG